MIGYLYFLWHNREVSYRAALHMTVSHRQTQLYQSRGLDLQKWQARIEAANALRAEIKSVADEYDVDWDETMDQVSDSVYRALRDERKKRRSRDGGEDGREEEDDNDGDVDGAKGKEPAKKE
jgi:N-methylhydantoinase B/oxoprolinase/acetone carboxylase alpha subunit